MTAPSIGAGLRSSARTRSPARPRNRSAPQAEALGGVAGLETHDRGKIIMACGTGKICTVLQIAERLVAPGGLVLFLVPSISLLSQSIKE